MKLKPVEKYELENIARADTFVVFDCGLHGRLQTGAQELLGGWEAAKRIALEKDSRKLVYAYNKKLEESGALSRQILLDEKNIRLYEEWVQTLTTEKETCHGAV